MQCFLFDGVLLLLDTVDMQHSAHQLKTFNIYQEILWLVDVSSGSITKKALVLL